MLSSTRFTFKNFGRGIIAKHKRIAKKTPKFHFLASLFFGVGLHLQPWWEHSPQVGCSWTIRSKALVLCLMRWDYTKLIRDCLNVCLPKEMWIRKSKGEERSENGGERFLCYFIIVLSSALLPGLYLRSKRMPSEPSFLNPFPSLLSPQLSIGIQEGCQLDRLFSLGLVT